MTLWAGWPGWLAGKWAVICETSQKIIATAISPFNLMFFAKQNKAPVQTLSLSLSNHNSTAFGPGSVISGILFGEIQQQRPLNIRSTNTCPHIRLVGSGTGQANISQQY
jgi:hypothetical protein